MPTESPETTALANPPKELGEQSKAQSNSPGILGLSIGGVWYSNGGDCGNPCAFPMYGDVYGRSYWTYRWILRHPVVRLVRAQVNAPVESSTVDFAKQDDSVPDERVNLVRDNFEPLWPKLVSDSLRGRDYGRASFEPIWDTDGGEWRLCEMKPLLPDFTTIVTDINGRFLGLSQGGLIGAPAFLNGIGQLPGLLAPYKAWNYVYDGECGNLYGRSWLENIRETAWKDWLDTAQQLQRLGGKIAGTQAIIKSPPELQADSIALIKSLANGAAGGWLPSLGFAVDPDGNMDLWKLVTELSKTSMIDIDVLDFGSTSQAIAGLIERLKHDESLMFNGGLLSSRVGLEGEHGTKAEAQTHTDTGVIGSQLILNDIANQLQPLVDALLVLNFGPKAAGSVKIAPAPLIDVKADRAMKIIAALAVQSDATTAMSEVVDVVQLFKDADAPIVEGAVWKPPARKTPPVPLDANGQPVTQPNGKQPPPNGKKLSPGVAKAVARFTGNKQ